MTASFRDVQVCFIILRYVLQYAQELLQTFSTSLGEVSLIPVTGGIFTVTITTGASNPASASPCIPEDDVKAEITVSTTVDQLLWDRKTDGGFPETKELKNRVRNVIEPDRDLGHIDRSLQKSKLNQSLTPDDISVTSPSKAPRESGANEGNGCKDCT